MTKQDKRYIFGCGGVGGWFEITTTSEKEATKIFMDALNAHPDIYCDWVDLNYLDFDKSEVKHEP